MKKFFILVALVLMFGFNQCANAITLDGKKIYFDDINPTGSVTTLGSYAGFEWENFLLYEVPPEAAGTGYGNGLLSGGYEIYSWSVHDQTITKTVSDPGDDDTFSFTEIWATASNNNDNLQLYLEGRLDGQAIITDLINLSTSGPAYRDYTGTLFENIDELYLKGLAGGVGYPGPDPFAFQYVLDSPAPTPEPSSMVLGLMGLGSLLGLRRKKV